MHTMQKISRLLRIVAGVLLVGYCLPILATNVANILFTRGMLTPTDAFRQPVEKVLNLAASVPFASYSVRWAHFREDIFVQNWSHARSDLRYFTMTQQRQITLGNWLVHSDNLIRTIRFEGMPPGLNALLQETHTGGERFLLIGNLYELAEQTENALSSYQKVTQDRRLEGEAYLRMGRLYAQQKKWKEAVTMLESAIRADPTTRIAAYEAMKRPLVSLGRRSEAIEHALALLSEADSQHMRYVYLMDLGYLYGRHDCVPCDFKQANSYFERAYAETLDNKEKQAAREWMNRADNSQD